MFIITILSILSLSAAVHVAPPDAGASPPHEPIFICSPGSPGGPDHEVIILASDDEPGQQAGRIKLRRVNPADGEPANGEATIKWMGAKPVEPGGPWLGVQFGPVPKPLMAQLGIEDGVGQMVLNVIEGSPADQAGFRQYDVILDMGGQKAPSDISEFLPIIQAYKPNQGAAFTLLRGGQRLGTNVIIGAKPEDMTDVKYKYELDTEELSQGRTFGRSGLLEKDAQGNWVFKGFNVKDLPDVWKAIPGIDEDDMFNIPVPGPQGGGNQVFVQKTQGKTVKIERGDNGQITVTTTTSENGQANTTTKTYANDQELQAADPEAFKMMQGQGPMHFRFFTDDGKTMDFLPADVRMRVHEAFKNHPGLWTPDDDGATPGGTPRVGMFAKRRANTSFEVTPEGRIKVTTRRGDEELVSEYENAEALKAAKPDLYRKYERLQQKGDDGR